MILYSLIALEKFSQTSKIYNICFISRVDHEKCMTKFGHLLLKIYYIELNILVLIQFTLDRWMVEFVMYRVKKNLPK